jgi:hypothetical protein
MIASHAPRDLAHNPGAARTTATTMTGRYSSRRPKSAAETDEFGSWWRSARSRGTCEAAWLIHSPLEAKMLALDDIEIGTIVPKLHVRQGKGQKARDIALEKKAVQALATYLKVRGDSPSPVLFLNYKGESTSERSVEKLVTKSAKPAGIAREVTCDSLRHTFATV